MSISELNKLYLTSQFLKVDGIKSSIAAYLASKVYITDLPSYNWKRYANDLKVDLTC